ncbi:MAG TPA: ATP-binding protein, partial [Chthoniobacterales bacterium]
ISQLNDISARKQMERELREREEHFRRLADDTPAMLWMSGTELSSHHFNKSALGFIGRNLEPEKGLGWLAAVHPDDRGDCLKACERGFAQRARFHLVYRLRRWDGEYRIIQDISSPRYDNAGAFCGYIGVCTDITDQLNTETELRATLEIAREANQAKSTFLAMMSHEIRTPLHSIIGFTHLLLDSGIPEDHRNLVSPILSGGEMLLAVINDILDYSKIEAGKVELERLKFSLPQCVQEVSGLFSAKAGEKNLKFNHTMCSDVPELVVGDLNRLRQILTNLLSNAVKFTAHGHVSIAVSGEGFTENRHLLHFIIRDTGIGFPREKVADLFQPFRQLDTSTTRKYGGTGLGLAICKRLVDAMQGRIHVESSPNEGSTFHVHLPFEAADRQTPALPAARVHSPQNQALRPITLLSTKARALNILVAEDNETNRRLIAQLLNRMGLPSAQLVNDGHSALRACALQTFDLILMDCQMPVMDGYEATRRLRQTAAGKKTMVVALTAAALAGDKEKALQAGMNDYLTKPIRPELLAEVLERAVPPGDDGAPLIRVIPPRPSRRE